MMNGKGASFVRAHFHPIAFVYADINVWMERGTGDAGTTCKFPTFRTVQQCLQIQSVGKNCG